MNAKIEDLTKNYNPGKWIEVGTLCTNDPNENPDIIGKFKSVNIARDFAKFYDVNYVGFHTIVIR